MDLLKRRAGMVILAALWLAVGPVRANETSAELSRVLLLPEVAVLLREEGIQYGADLDRDFLGASGSAHFKAQIDRIYDRGAMLSVMEQELSANLSAEAMARSLAFYTTPTGQKILALEMSARRAITQEAVEEAARQAVTLAAKAKDARAGDVVAFIEINDLTELNVAGALSSNFQFLSGLAAGGGQDMSEAEIIDQVWAQEDEVRTDTDAWLNAFLFMAYGPLDDAEMQAYLDFSRSDAGQDLNAALFAGFNAMYRTIYYALGISVAQAMQTSEL